MVREKQPIFESATALELGLTSQECDKVMKNRTFQKILRGYRNEYYNELARDPKRSKDTLVGQAIQAIEHLMEGKAYDKALTGILALAKIEGFVGSDTNINVFSGLSTKDMADLKAKLKRDQDGPPQSQGTA
jgi:hypothetical protein